MRGGKHILKLDLATRRDALLTAASRSGKTEQILEKDVWVVWALGVLFRGPHKDALAFKGGTSLSKAYQLIDRFSEDVDLTYDIRKLIGSEENQPEFIPSTKSQAKSWTKVVRERLPGFVEGEIPQVRHSSRHVSR